MRQWTPTPTGAVPEQRGRAAGGGSVRRARETVHRATVPDVHAVRGHDHDDDDHYDAAVRGPRVLLENVQVVGVLGHLRTGRAHQTRGVPALQQGLVVERRGGRRGALRDRCGPAAGHAEGVRRPTAVRRSRGGQHHRHRRRNARARRVRLAVRRVARVFARLR